MLRGREWSGKYFVNLGVENIRVVSGDGARAFGGGDGATRAVGEPMVKELHEEVPW